MDWNERRLHRIQKLGLKHGIFTIDQVTIAGDSSPIELPQLKEKRIDYLKKHGVRFKGDMEVADSMVNADLLLKAFAHYGPNNNLKGKQVRVTINLTLGELQDSVSSDNLIIVTMPERLMYSKMIFRHNDSVKDELFSQIIEKNRDKLEDWMKSILG
ncbi:hypothetical protein [Vibrio owensii]|uniref:hypothetical protein n=1 Tax=Vibrio harveyi group TaxID=717610 RepID=UPI003CC57584